MILNDSDKGPFSAENLPMKLAGMLTVALLVAALAGCNLKENYARNNLATDQWLQANIGSSRINVTGPWEAEESRWELFASNKLGRE